MAQKPVDSDVAAEKGDKKGVQDEDVKGFKKAERKMIGRTDQV